MAYAGALFADSCLRGLNGDSNVFDYSYVESDVTDVPFFSSRVDLGPDGTYSLAHAVCMIALLFNRLYSLSHVHVVRLACSVMFFIGKLTQFPCASPNLKCAQVLV